MRQNRRRNLSRHLRLIVEVMFLVRICRSSHLRPPSLSLHLHLKDNLPLLYLLKDNLLLSLSLLKNNLFLSLLLLKNPHLLHLLLKGTLHLFLNELILYPLLVPNLHVRYQKPCLHIVQKQQQQRSQSILLDLLDPPYLLFVLFSRTEQLHHHPLPDLSRMVHLLPLSDHSRMVHLLHL